MTNTTPAATTYTLTVPAKDARDLAIRLRNRLFTASWDGEVVTSNSPEMEKHYKSMLLAPSRHMGVAALSENRGF